MNKQKLRDFAMNARKSLIEQIDFKIKLLDPLGEYNTQEVADKIVFINEKRNFELTKKESESRLALKKRINEIGYEQTVEEVAYTWFNRLVAIRYMEVNEFLPLGIDNTTTDIRILSNRKKGSIDPEIIEYANLYNKFIDIGIDYNLIEKHSDNYQEIYPYIILKVCEKLGKILPQMFDGITDYIDILLPNNLLAENSIIRQLTDLEMITEEEWKEQVEIIGWLYQYYISEKKDEVFSKLKKNIKIKKENIPAATQLFTPDWVVKYMVENTLGKIIIENNNKKELKQKWMYYIESSNENAIHNKYQKSIIPTDLKIIDPCMGSGHILVYCFRTLMQIYKLYGYPEKDSAKLILENNIHGLDIDDRAGQLSYFALIMEARKYDKDILKNVPKINVMAVQESNNLNIESLSLLDNDNSEIIEYLLRIFKDAKEYGSILNVEKKDYEKILTNIEELENKELNIIEQAELKDIIDKFLPLVKQAIIMSNNYDVTVTNPPYMSNKGMTELLLNYVKKNYDDTKADMFAVFIEKCRKLTKKDGYYAMITQPSVLFLSSFEKLRKKIITEQSICSVLHMGRGVFGIDFGSTAFVIRNSFDENFVGSYFKLHERTFQYIDNNDIEKLFLQANKDHHFKFDFSLYNYKDEIIEIQEDETEEIEDESKKEQLLYFEKNQNNFLEIPGMPIAYWITPKMQKLFKNTSVGDLFQAKQGMVTGNNNKFLRYWYEVEENKIGFLMSNKEEAKQSNKKWFPYNKGGDYRKWYGNNDYVVNWYDDGAEMKEYTSKLPQGTSVRLKSQEYYFKESITWSFISSNYFGARYSPKGFIFDVGGSSIFPEINKRYLLAYLTTNIVYNLLKVINPTMNYQIKDIRSLPIIIDKKYENEIEELAEKCIEISKNDWDSFETSWDFRINPLVKIGMNSNKSLKECFEIYKNNTENDFQNLKKYEEEINKIFIKIYDLSDEIDYNVSEKTIRIRRAEVNRDIKALISYFIGCLMGRYSLDKEGLIFAGGDFEKCFDSEVLNNVKFKPDSDSILPLNDEEYFEDDVITKFCEFLNLVFGKENLEENLDFIANALGKKNSETSRESIRNYFINGFYEDHCKTYQKRPIYWLFDSGKENGFKSLIYIHRYTHDMVAKVRMDYLHNLQRKYETLINSIDIRLETTGNLVDIKLQEKRKQKYTKQLNETRKYDEKIKHLADQNIKIDLDDGIIENYNKFKDILAKIK